MFSGYINNLIAWDGLLHDGLFHLFGKIVVVGPTFLWSTELLLAGLFIIILLGIFLFGTAYRRSAMMGHF